MLDHVLIHREGLVGNAKLKGSLGCSNHGMVEFKGGKEGAQQAHYPRLQESRLASSGPAWCSTLGQSPGGPKKAD